MNNDINHIHIIRFVSHSRRILRDFCLRHLAPSCVAQPALKMMIICEFPTLSKARPNRAPRALNRQFERTNLARTIVFFFVLLHVNISVYYIY